MVGIDSFSVEQRTYFVFKFMVCKLRGRLIFAVRKRLNI